MSDISVVDVQRFNEIAKEVGEWSIRNFGLQMIKVGWYPDADHSGLNQGNYLGMIAPLMGIVEEFGELGESGEVPDITDAFGDVAVYLADFCSRGGFVVSVADYSKTTGVCLGRIYHCVLKRCQGIRGYDDDAKFRTEVCASVSSFFAALDLRCRTVISRGIIDVLEETWAQVKQRDWTKNKKQGT